MLKQIKTMLLLIDYLFSSCFPDNKLFIKQNEYLGVVYDEVGLYIFNYW